MPSSSKKEIKVEVVYFQDEPHIIVPNDVKTLVIATKNGMFKFSLPKTQSGKKKK